MIFPRWRGKATTDALLTGNWNVSESTERPTRKKREEGGEDRHHRDPGRFDGGHFGCPSDERLESPFCMPKVGIRKRGLRTQNKNQNMIKFKLRTCLLILVVLSFLLAGVVVQTRNNHSNYWQKRRSYYLRLSDSHLASANSLKRELLSIQNDEASKEKPEGASSKASSPDKKNESKMNQYVRKLKNEIQFHMKMRDSFLKDAEESISK